MPDSDGDGLWDGDELRNGTDPLLKDSDGDGLWDNDEVKGWEFVYGFDASGNQMKSWVWPDPLSVDLDQDGLTDFQEKTYGYNPAAMSNPNVLTLNSELREGTALTDGFVTPNQTLTYNATVKNELYNRQAQGQLWTEASPALDDSGVQAHSLRAAGDGAERRHWQRQGVVYRRQRRIQHDPGGWGADYRLERGRHQGQPVVPLRRPRPPVLRLFRQRAAPRWHLHGGLGSAPDCAMDTSGRFGSALKLGGTSYVLSYAGAPATGYAVSLWFKTTTGGKLFAGENAGNRLSFGQRSDLGDNGIHALVGPIGPGSFHGAMVDGKWHHVVQTVGNGAPGTNLDLRQKLYCGRRVGRHRHRHLSVAADSKLVHRQLDPRRSGS